MCGTPTLCCAVCKAVSPGARENIVFCLEVLGRIAGLGFVSGEALLALLIHKIFQMFQPVSNVRVQLIWADSRASFLRYLWWKRGVSLRMEVNGQGFTLHASPPFADQCPLTPWVSCTLS